MLSLCESHPASVYHVCSYLTNQERLQLGLSAKTFLSFLKPLFMALAHDFNCRAEFKLPNEEFQRLTSNEGIMSGCASTDYLHRLHTLGSRCAELKAKCRVAAYWKDLNDRRLTYDYNPCLISDFTKIKKMSEEAHTLDFLFRMFKVDTPEAAMRHVASKPKNDPSKLEFVTLDQFKLLCRYASDIDQPSTNGNTALDWALKAKNEDFAHVWLEHKANCRLKNKLGQTPLHFAVLLESDNLAGKLIARGADFRAKDNEGKTPLDRAIEHKNVNCIALLKEKMK